MNAGLERAARALYARRAEFAGNMHPLAFEELQREARMALVCDVRAVVAALREPTEEMCDAGYHAANLTRRWDNGIPDAMADHWRSMIDALLAEGGLRFRDLFRRRMTDAEVERRLGIAPMSDLDIARMASDAILSIPPMIGGFEKTRVWIMPDGSLQGHNPQEAMG